jgi:hypothetical protein
MKFQILDLQTGKAEPTTKKYVMKLISNHYNKPEEVFKTLLIGVDIHTPNFLISCLN